MDFLTDLKKFLSIKSIPEEGNEQAINFLIPYFEQLGAKIVIQHVPHSFPQYSKRQFNLIALFGDTIVDNRIPNGFLLIANCETPPPGTPSQWKKMGGDPWHTKEIEGRIYGIGAASGKANIFAMLAAVNGLQGTTLKRPLYIATTCGGESHLTGTKYLLQSGVINPKRVVMGRPSGLKLIVEETSRLVLQLNISYVAIERHAQDFSAKVLVNARSKFLPTYRAEADRGVLHGAFSFFDFLSQSPIMHHFISFDGVGEINRTPESSSIGIVVRPADLDSISHKFKEFISKRPETHFEFRMGGTGERGIKLLPGELYPVLSEVRNIVVDFNRTIEESQSKKYVCGHPWALISSLKQEKSHLELVIQLNLEPQSIRLDDLEKTFRERVKQLNLKYLSLSMELRKLSGSKGYITDIDSGYVDTLKSDLLNSGLDPQMLTGMRASDGSLFFSPQRDVVGFGAGDPFNDSYTFDESVSISDWQSAVRFYRQSIEGFCERGI